MKDAVGYAEKSPYKHVLVSDSFQCADLFVIFYTQFPPLEYQRKLSRGDDRSFGKYRICSVRDKVAIGDRALFIVTPQEAKELLKRGQAGKVYHVIKDPSGQEQVVLVEVTGT